MRRRTADSQIASIRRISWRISWGFGKLLNQTSRQSYRMLCKMCGIPFEDATIIMKPRRIFEIDDFDNDDDHEESNSEGDSDSNED